MLHQNCVALLALMNTHTDAQMLLNCECVWKWLTSHFSNWASATSNFEQQNKNLESKLK